MQAKQQNATANRRTVQQVMQKTNKQKKKPDPFGEGQGIYWRFLKNVTLQQEGTVQEGKTEEGYTVQIDRKSCND